MGAIRTRRLDANGLTFTIDEAGEGDIVALLLHGFPESRATWHAQLPALADLGWRVVAPDLRGYGDTTRPKDQAAYRLESLTADVDALFDALGARRRILVGHDWGGVIAWQTALRARTALDGLVVLNAPHPAVFRRVAGTIEQRLRSWYVLFFLLPGLPEWNITRRKGANLADILRKASPAFSDSMLELLCDNVVRPGAAKAMVDYYRANALALVSSAWPEPPALVTPTLMIWGDEDAALSPRLTEGNEAYVRDFTLRRLPGVTHWVQHEVPDQVNALISEWAREKGLSSERR